MTAALVVSPWAEAQAHERAYWYPDDATAFARRRQEERERQAWYAGLLLLDVARPASVIELGAGPQGLLTRARLESATRLVAVEPMPLRSDDAARYAMCGAALWTLPVEALPGLMPAVEPCEEVWMTNLLQHVADPVRVMRVATTLATGRLRLFEWIEEPESAVHLHTITAEWMRAMLVGWVPEFETEGYARSSAGWLQAFVAGVYRREAAA